LEGMFGMEMTLVHIKCVSSSLSICTVLCFMWGQAVAYFIEALRYNLEGCGFDSR